jgi:hypothetical protein
MSKVALCVLSGILTMLGSIIAWLAALTAFVQLTGVSARNPIIQIVLVLVICISSMYMSRWVQMTLRRRLGID